MTDSLDSMIQDVKDKQIEEALMKIQCSDWEKCDKCKRPCLLNKNYKKKQ